MEVQKTDFQKQIDKLLEKEKIARVNNQHLTSVNILKEIITVCYKANQHEKMREMIEFLMGRRGQSKKAQIEMIQLAMGWLNEMKEPERTQLIEAVRDVTAKKIYLQVEYARCVLMIVKGKQDDNDIMEAAKILQEVQVETYGSMDKREKLEFILYQMRIMLKKEDYVRLYIISKKINENNINDDQIADIKILYYSYMAFYNNHQNNYYEAARCYKIIWETLLKTKKIIPQTLDFGFSTNTSHVLGNYIGFLILEPYSGMTETELKTLFNDQRLEKYPTAYNLIQKFLSEEIIPCDPSQYNLTDFPLFNDGFVSHNVHQQDLKKMLVQHNVRIISKYYGRITLQRVAGLCEVEKHYCEEELCTLNNKKIISCRVDRIDDIVDFRPLENEDHLVKTWNSSINGVLDLVDEAANLIHREREVYRK